MRWHLPYGGKSTCAVDVKYFPFDIQVCEMKFGSWEHDMSVINLVTKSKDGDNSSFLSNNSEFELREFTVRRHETHYPCCEYPYVDVTYYTVVCRLPMYYLFNLFLPCVCLVMMAAVGFFIPVESGEKISLGVTVVLSLTVFLLLVAEKTPPQSNSIPMLSEYEQRRGLNRKALLLLLVWPNMVLFAHERPCPTNFSIIRQQNQNYLGI